MAWLSNKKGDSYFKHVPFLSSYEKLKTISLFGWAAALSVWIRALPWIHRSTFLWRTVSLLFFSWFWC